MAKRFCSLLLFFLSFCVFSQGMNILSETIKCNSQCERTYPLHTYPTIRHNRACQQGCYRAVKIKAYSALGFHIRNCSEGCKGQYFEAGSLYACKVGCEKGQDVNSKKEEAASFPDKPTPASNEQRSTVAAMILRPVMFLHAYGRGMINKLTYYVQSSTSYYFRTNNGGMVVVNIQREPQIFVQASNHYPIVQNDEPETKNGIQEHSYSEGDESWIVVRRGHHWLHCVSHKSGIPLWVLTSILFLSSFFLLWLCCASTTSTPAVKKSARKAFLIKDFVSRSKDKSGQDVPLLKLDDEEEQAKPLPSKTRAAILTI